MAPDILSRITSSSLLRAGLYAPLLTAAMAKYSIVSKLQQAAFLAQVAVESAWLTTTEENLSYTAERLVAVWPARFPTIAAAAPFARNPAALANKVYGGRMGNVEPGDGYRYRGRGLIQLTGRASYTEYARASGVDAIASPAVVAQPFGAADSAGWFWQKSGCGALADARDFAGVSRLVNGGTHGLAERLALTTRALAVL